MNRFIVICFFATSCSLVLSISGAANIRVAVKLDNSMEDTKGKILVTLKGLNGTSNFTQDIPLQEHMTDIVKGSYYSKIVHTPFDMTLVNSTSVLFRKKVMGNLLGPNLIKVHFVSIEELNGQAMDRNSNNTAVCSPSQVTILGRTQRFCTNFNETTLSISSVIDEIPVVFGVKCGKIRE